MIVKTDLGYRDFIDKHDNGKRRSGRTTKIVDQLISDFFTEGIANCYDHYPTNDMYEYVMHKVLGRLEYEHNFPIKEIKIDMQRNILVNKLIPDSTIRYTELINGK